MPRNPPLLPKTKTHARQLRQELTVPERLLWGKLRSGRLCGLKFRRQHPIDSFIVDFLCDEHGLIVELDGNSHIDSAAYDLQRQRKLEALGFRVLRVHNDDVIQDLDSVLAAILHACGIESAFPPATTYPPSPASLRSAPSPGGRGLMRPRPQDPEERR